MSVRVDVVPIEKGTCYAVHIQAYLCATAQTGFSGPLGRLTNFLSLRRVCRHFLTLARNGVI